MKEFGSDFHKLDWSDGKSIIDKIDKQCRLYALGRHALESILLQENIECLWLPTYFCHESIISIEKLVGKIKYYSIIPTDNPYEIVGDLPIEKDDFVFLMNYFGLWGHLHTPNLECKIIEDHSHDLTSNWALTSRANWCIASLRKTLPIAEGGILWSPVGHKLPAYSVNSQVHLQNAVHRQTAMEMKLEYLSGGQIEKELFLNMYRETENQFDRLPISPISEVSKLIVEKMDIDSWYSVKKSNWTILSHLMDKSKATIIVPDSLNNTLFSLILLFENTSIRNKIRYRLIENGVYPAILWPIPEKFDHKAQYFGERMLSFHCDGRYKPEDMYELADIINQCMK